MSSGPKAGAPAVEAAALWCRSNFSFLEGASHPAELVQEAHALGLKALALTDRAGVYGVVRAHVAAKELGFPLIIGATLSVDDALAQALDDGLLQRLSSPDGAHSKPPSAHGQSGSDEIVLLASSAAGYAKLCKLISRGQQRAPKGDCVLRWSEVCEAAPGLIALWNCNASPSAAPALAGRLRDAFGDALYALIARHRRMDEVARERRFRKLARRLEIPLVAAPEVLYHTRARRPLQDILTAIRHGVTLATAGSRLRPNDEYALQDPAALAELYADLPGALANTLSIAERCSFSLDEIRFRYPLEKVPGGLSSSEHLRQLTLEGAFERYGGAIPSDVRAQLARELQLIEELDYGGYFLTMKEIVNYCRDRGILCQGRGSAANSAVCFCLGITAVDPVRMGLLFERFLSRERAEPPDIDLDIEHSRREEVIQHVYKSYGRERAAMVANLIRYRPRSAVRDVGKALDIPASTLERLTKTLPWWGSVPPGALAEAGMDEDAPVNRHLLRLSQEILSFPRHLAIHPGGFLLGHEPVHQLVPIENATMPGRTIIQWDKNDVEALGLFKVDLLALGALTQLRLCFDLIAQHRGVLLDLASIPPDDPDTYAMICEADTVGVFQIESRAQMAMLPRLKPRSFHDLVVEISIVRPGPISGDMVHPYLRRREGLEEVSYPHPLLEPVLERTLGIPLFQEQVMRLAVVAADYTPGEADQLRRDMAAWRIEGKIEAHRERLISRMVAKGIEAAFAERVFEQIRGFGEYGFPESHAASFALLSYATSYVRCHFLPEFVCSLLNAQPMGFYSPATILEDARRHGLEVRPIDVLYSTWEARLEPVEEVSAGQFPLALRLGAGMLKGLRLAEWSALERARMQGQGEGEAPPTLESLLGQSGVGRTTVEILAEAGALESLAPGRREALWQGLGHAVDIARPLPLLQAMNGGGSGDAGELFEPLTPVEEMAWDYDSAGVSVSGHPLKLLRPVLAAAGLPDARGISESRDGARVRYAGLVSCRQRPMTASGTVFMTLEDEAGFVNLVVWPKVFESYKRLLKGLSFLGVSGKVQTQDGVTHLVVDKAWEPDFSRPAALGRSRDFH